MLFVSLVFFAFAQAAVARNGAQSAADAAALAAAQDSRDEMLDELIKAIEESSDGGDGNWLDWLTGEAPADQGAARAASSLASDNDADVVSVEPMEQGGFPGYRVEIRTRYTVGDSIVPGTESKHATADASALIKPRCDADADADPEKPVELDCGGDVFEIDPGDFDPDELPDASTFFSVHLAE